MIRPTHVEVDLGALVENARTLARACQPRGSGGAALWAVVKADAYGHGAVAVARALAAAGAAERFAVSLVEEAVELRDAGVLQPILVMGPALAGGYDALATRDITVVVSDEGEIEPLAAAGRRGNPVTVHLKIDTGMGRLGLPLERALELLSRCRNTPGLRLTGMCSHLACADSDPPGDPSSMTRAQLDAFAALADRARKSGLGALELHIANSAGLLRFPESHYHAVRPGLALYGGVAGAGLKPVMRLCTAIAQLRAVPAGQSVSYGATWRAERPSRIAVLPVGYADGLPRNASNRAEALVRGRRVPLCGTISMDISLADVTDLGDAVGVGDAVVLFGSQENELIDVTEFARSARVIEYEVTCGISKRVPRIYG